MRYTEVYWYHTIEVCYFPHIPFLLEKKYDCRCMWVLVSLWNTPTLIRIPKYGVPLRSTQPLLDIYSEVWDEVTEVRMYTTVVYFKRAPLSVIIRCTYSMAHTHLPWSKRAADCLCLPGSCFGSFSSMSNTASMTAERRDGLCSPPAGSFRQLAGQLWLSRSHKPLYGSSFTTFWASQSANVRAWIC